MSTGRTRYVCAASVFLLAVLLVFTQMAADKARASYRGDELLYLPNEKLLNHFTGGMSSIVADLLWLKCVQYTGKESKGERNFTWLDQMLDTVVRLDPHFVDVYRYGGMFLASLKAEDDAGLKLLNRGIVANPHSWELPYEAALIFLLNRRDQPGSKEKAAYYLAMGAAQEDAPQLIRDLAVKLQGEHNLTDIERQMWQDLAKSDDKLLRETAARKLRELNIREIVRVLNERAKQYKGSVGKEPTSVQDLMQPDEISRILPEPLGGRYFIGPDGVVRNTTLLDDQTKQTANALRSAIKVYKEKQGKPPESLEALVEAGIIPEIPAHPYPDRDWNYDPTTGEISG